MVSTINVAQRYQRQAKVDETETVNKSEVTFVPALVDVRTPTRNIVRGLQFRRQFVDFFAGFVSGAVSIR